jgi:hypothetical protein
MVTEKQMFVNWTKTVELYLNEGRTVSGGCGSSGAQRTLQAEQQKNYQDMINQAQQVFGDSSAIFGDLKSAFEPILAAGPGQPGYTASELATLRSEAITNTGAAYRNASQVAGERIAASGGGNAVLPSGTTAAVEGNIATAGAAQTAGALTNIDIQNAEVGRQNWLNAAGVLSGASNVFNPATSMENAATSAGSAESSTAAEMAGQTQQLWGASIGAAGQAAGAIGQAL